MIVSLDKTRREQMGNVSYSPETIIHLMSQRIINCWKKRSTVSIDDFKSIAIQEHQITKYLGAAFQHAGAELTDIHAAEINNIIEAKDPYAKLFETGDRVRLITKGNIQTTLPDHMHGLTGTVLAYKETIGNYFVSWDNDDEGLKHIGAPKYVYGMHLEYAE